MNPNDITSKYYDIVYKSCKGAEITDQELQLIQSLARTNSSILDIGGGTGRHAIPLVEMNYSVDVVDLSRGMLDVLEDKIQSKNRKVEIYNQDIYKFTSKKKYDLIIMFWNAFNEIALTEDSAFDLLLKCKELLNTEGKILINIDDSSKINPSLFDVSETVKNDNITYHSFWKRISFDEQTNTSVSEERIVVEQDNKVIDDSKTLITQRWWSKDLLESLAAKTGLSISYLNIKGNEELYIVLTTI